MSLPRYSDFKAVWIEKTKASHEHGGTGWEFGSCLWSPSANAVGHKIYEDMRAIQLGDLILHFYEDSWFGGEDTYHFCAYSIVSSTCAERTDEPPKAGEWAGRGKYLRVELKNFTPFDKRLRLKNSSKRMKPRLYLRQVVQMGRSYFSGSPAWRRVNTYRHVQSLSIRFCQQRYKSRSKSVRPWMSFLQQQKMMLLILDVHEQFLEGQRQRRETSFFLRNRSFVKKAKQKHGTVCQCCGFAFSQKYGAIGDGFIECHHLKPLSERYGQSQTPVQTSVNDVAVLCANCHRMIHRMMHKEKRWIGLTEFTKCVK